MSYATKPLLSLIKNTIYKAVSLRKHTIYHHYKPQVHLINVEKCRNHAIIWKIKPQTWFAMSWAHVKMCQRHDQVWCIFVLEIKGFLKCWCFMGSWNYEFQLANFDNHLPKQFILNILFSCDCVEMAFCRRSKVQRWSFYKVESTLLGYIFIHLSYSIFKIYHF